MNGKYKLVDRKPVPVEDVIEWARAFEKDDRIVKQETLPNGPSVSTVFLGTDHNFTGHGPPLLFETMIFGGPHDNYQDRYATWEEAEAGHARARAIALGEGPP